VEFPQIQKLTDKFNPRGFAVVTINILPSNYEAGKFVMAKRCPKFINLTAPDDSWASDNYQIRVGPTTVLLDAQGKVILQHAGYSSKSIREMDEAIVHLTEAAKMTK
jgi:thioredoxin-related protein